MNKEDVEIKDGGEWTHKYTRVSTHSSPSGNTRMYPYYGKELATVTTNTDFGLRNIWSQTTTYFLPIL